MSVHITKTYNIGGLIGLRQNAVKNAGETLGFKEMSLFKFPDAYDSDDELHVRMDGIIASLCPEDIVIFQHPSGSAARGKMAVRELIVFKHSKELGDCPAYKLFDAVKVQKNDDIQYPRKYQDYTVTINDDEIPDTVEVKRMI